MGYIEPPRNRPMIYHEVLGNRWSNEKDWIEYLALKYRNVAGINAIRKFQESQETHFVVFFLTRFPEGEHAQIPHLMMAVCIMKEGFGKYIEVKSIYRYGFFGEVRSIEEVAKVVSDNEIIRILITHSVPTAFVGNVKDYRDLLAKIYDKMKEVNL